jgi:hypothetical protein
VIEPLPEIVALPLIVTLVRPAIVPPPIVSALDTVMPKLLVSTVPLTVRLVRLTDVSTSTVWPEAIVTLSPVVGTPAGDQVDGDDQLPLAAEVNTAAEASRAVRPAMRRRAATRKRVARSAGRKPPPFAVAVPRVIIRTPELKRRVRARADDWPRTRIADFA